MIALVDANNFYCSAERVFNPSLQSKPIIVLSNNDGCVISRSNEAKQLGIKMAKPLYQVQSLCDQYQVKIFSSNYQLYGDISQRIMQSLSYFSPQIEVYSIDEAFINLTDFNRQSLIPYARNIKRSLLQWTGVPVAIGIGPNKVLAKLANHIAKKVKGNGVFQLDSLDQENQIMEQLMVDEIWGIGRKSCLKLKVSDIYSIWDLYQASPLVIRQLLGINGLQIFYALHGEIHDTLNFDIKDKKSIGSSRSFAQTVSSLDILNSALANYVMLATQKLRKQALYAQAIQVYISTNPHQLHAPQYHKHLTTSLEQPSDNTGELIGIAKLLLKKIYRPGFQYQKVGVLLLDLTHSLQLGLFQVPYDHKNSKLMTVVDDINQKMGNNNVFFLAQGINQHWRTKRDYQSPHYTTQWKDLPLVK